MDNQPRVMQCSEVWGGNDEVDRGVAMPGMDAWVLSRPSAGEALGGDIHYVSSCATGRITRILLADVAGHGQAVAALAHRLRAIMRRFVNHVDQTRVAALINREFAALGEAGEFATAVVATFWGPTGEIDITNAGHPPPLFYSGRTAQWSYLNRNDDASGDMAVMDNPGDGFRHTTHQDARLRFDEAFWAEDALMWTRVEAAAAGAAAPR